MKIIGKMTGLRLLEEITNNNISCGTMIRYKRDDLILCSNPPKPVYEYYKFTKGDGRFHRCDENGKLGAKGQKRFMNYGTLTKEFEILEEVEDKEYEDIEEISYKYVNTYGNISQHRKSEEPLIETINALIRNQQKIIKQLENK